MTRIITRRAEPTLQGLRVVGKSGDPGTCETLYPWDRVSRPSGGPSTFWTVYNEDGGEVLEDGRRLRLRTRNTWAGRLAYRAQVRWFRRAWRNETLCVEERYASTGRGCMWTSAVYVITGCTVFGGAAAALAVRIWQTYLRFSLPLGLTALSCTLFGLLALSLLAIALGVAGSAARVGRHANVTRSRVDGEGTRVVLRDGKTVYGAWKDLQKIQYENAQFISLRFDSADDIWLGPVPARTRLVLEVVRDALQPESIQQDKRASQRLLLRVVLLWELGCLAAVALVMWISVDPRRWLAYIPLFVVPAIIAGKSYLLPRLQHYEKRCYRRCERRKRRREL